MRRIFLIILISLFSFACSDEMYEFPSVEGKWILSEYNVTDGFDINNDGEINVNLLKEIDCLNSEILIFESTGIVSSMSSFNPDIHINLAEDTNEYIFEVRCDREGLIGWATSYIQTGETISYSNATATVMNEELHVVFEDALNIYDINNTQVIETHDLIMVYTKQ
jgi:Ca2+-binding EF-hand superfamily protein